jgi:hypothetical protein
MLVCLLCKQEMVPCDYSNDYQCQFCILPDSILPASMSMGGLQHSKYYLSLWPQDGSISLEEIFLPYNGKMFNIMNQMRAQITEITIDNDWTNTIMFPKLLDCSDPYRTIRRIHDLLPFL